MRGTSGPSALQGDPGAGLYIHCSNSARSQPAWYFHSFQGEHASIVVQDGKWGLTIARKIRKLLVTASFLISNTRFFH